MTKNCQLLTNMINSYPLRVLPLHKEGEFFTIIKSKNNTVPLSEEGQRGGALLATTGGLAPQRSADRPAKRREFDKQLHSQPPTNMVNSYPLRVLPLHKEGEFFGIIKVPSGKPRETIKAHHRCAFIICGARGSRTLVQTGKPYAFYTLSHR